MITGKTILAAAFWLNLFLAGFALVLLMPWLLLGAIAVNNSADWTSIELRHASALLPVIFAITPWLYHDVLVRAYLENSQQRSKRWIICLSLIGASVLLFLILAAILNGWNLVFYIPIAIGLLAFGTALALVRN